MVECKITKIAEDGLASNLIDTDIVGPIQMPGFYICFLYVFYYSKIPGATWIKDLKVLINQREVYSSNQLYSYKVFLDTELSYPTSVKDSFLNVCGYHRDSKDPDHVDDTGFKARKNMFKNSNVVQLISKLSADIFNTNLFLINNVEVDIIITPQNSDFMIIQKKNTPPDNNKYGFEITDVRLLVKTLDVMDGLSLDIARKLDVESAKYGIRKSFLKSLFISAGRTDFAANLFTEE